MGLDPTNEVTPTYLYTWVIIALNAGGECSQRRFFFITVIELPNDEKTHKISKYLDYRPSKYPSTLVHVRVLGGSRPRPDTSPSFKSY